MSVTHNPDRVAKTPAVTRALPPGHPGPTEDDLQFTPINETGWRVTDARFPPDDPLHLIACIQEQGESCVVMQIGATFQWHLCATFDQAVTHILLTAKQIAHERLRGDLLWITCNNSSGDNTRPRL